MIEITRNDDQIPVDEYMMSRILVMAICHLIDRTSKYKEMKLSDLVNVTPEGAEPLDTSKLRSVLEDWAGAEKEYKQVVTIQKALKLGVIS